MRTAAATTLSNSSEIDSENIDSGVDDKIKVKWDYISNQFACATNNAGETPKDSAPSPAQSLSDGDNDDDDDDNSSVNCSDISNGTIPCNEEGDEVGDCSGGNATKDDSLLLQCTAGSIR